MLSLVRHLDTFNQLKNLLPDKKKLKNISKEIIEIYLELEEEFFKVTPEKFNKGKLLEKVTKGKTTFSEELKYMGIGKFLRYGNYYGKYLVYDSFTTKFEENLKKKVALLDYLIKENFP